jgi:hypothetical protein
LLPFCELPVVLLRLDAPGTINVHFCAYNQFVSFSRFAHFGTTVALMQTVIPRKVLLSLPLFVCVSRHFFFALPPSESAGSVVPSIHPSFRPSFRPSVLPPFRPSVLPSVRPSFRPSVHPSFRPSVLPSFRPSVRPFVVPRLSVLPSIKVLYHRRHHYQYHHHYHYR